MKQFGAFCRSRDNGAVERREKRRSSWKCSKQGAGQSRVSAQVRRAVSGEVDSRPMQSKGVGVCAVRGEALKTERQSPVAGLALAGS